MCACCILCCQVMLEDLGGVNAGYFSAMLETYSYLVHMYAILVALCLTTGALACAQLPAYCCLQLRLILKCMCKVNVLYYMQGCADELQALQGNARITSQAGTLAMPLAKLVEDGASKLAQRATGISALKACCHIAAASHDADEALKQNKVSCCTNCLIYWLSNQWMRHRDCLKLHRSNRCWQLARLLQRLATMSGAIFTWWLTPVHCKTSRRSNY